MDIPSLKKEIITEFLAITTSEELSDHDLVLVTPIGVIYGRVSNKESKDLVESSLSTLSLKVFTDYKAEYEIGESTRLSGNDGFIMLSNVTIKSAIATFSMPFLIVFYDQIIGVTLGKVN